MFHKKTVFIVGAGASVEANLPAGEGLAERISGLLSIPDDWAALDGERKVFASALKAYCEECNDLADHLKSCQRIARGLQTANSIDEFVDTFRNDQRIANIAKAAIAHTILKAERDSLFCERHSALTISNPLPPLKDKWYPSFGKLIVTQIAADEMDRLFENITIICFNYDRCIEEFLAHWLATRYAIELQEGRQLASRLTILRPYGRVAPLGAVAFGDTTRLGESFTLGQNIATFSEQIADDTINSCIRDAITEAQIIAFLGFGFHRQNMEILKPDRACQVENIFATAYKISHIDADEIRKELYRAFSNRGSTAEFDVKVDFQCDCTTLFKKYSRALNPLA